MNDAATILPPALRDTLPAPSSKRWTHDCTHCDGRGTTEDVDYNNDGTEIFSRVQCEACDGAGATSHCDDCGDVMSLVEGERFGYRCVECLIRHDLNDAAAESALLRRLT